MNWDVAAVATTAVRWQVVAAAADWDVARALLGWEGGGRCSRSFSLVGASSDEEGEENGTIFWVEREPVYSVTIFLG